MGKKKVKHRRSSKFSVGDDKDPPIVEPDASAGNSGSRRKSHRKGEKREQEKQREQSSYGDDKGAPNVEPEASAGLDGDDEDAPNVEPEAGLDGDDEDAPNVEPEAGNFGPPSKSYLRKQKREHRREQRLQREQSSDSDVPLVVVAGSESDDEDETSVPLVGIAGSSRKRWKSVRKRELRQHRDHSSDSDGEDGPDSGEDDPDSGDDDPLPAAHDALPAAHDALPAAHDALPALPAEQDDPDSGEDDPLPAAHDALPALPAEQDAPDVDDLDSGEDDSGEDDPDKEDAVFDLHSLAETVLLSWKQGRMKPKQKALSDLKHFHLSTRPSPEELENFYDESLQYFKDEFPFSVPVMNQAGVTLQVPITPEKEPDVESRRHHIIVLTRQCDGAKAELVVEDYSQYIVASRVLYLHDDPKVVPFCYFGDEGDDLPRIFYVPKTIKSEDKDVKAVAKAAKHKDGKAAGHKDGRAAKDDVDCYDNCYDDDDDDESSEDEDDDAAKEKDGEADTILHRTRYGPGYEYLSNVKVGEQTGDIIFFFLEKLQANPKQKSSIKGSKVLNTLYVFIPEGRRFRVAREWNLSRIVLPLSMESTIPPWLKEVINDWKALCKCVFLLFLSLLEEGLAVDDALMQSIAETTKRLATDLWKVRQNKLKEGELLFFQEKVPVNLNRLAGTELFVLKRYDEYCDQILMRLCGYKGYFMIP